jgi:hypothetical protein
MPDERETPVLRRKPDQASLPEAKDGDDQPKNDAGDGVVKKPVEAEADNSPEVAEVAAADEVVPVLPTLSPPYRVEGIGVVDSNGTLIAACGAPHHSLANHLAIANVVAAALNKG